MEIHIQQESLKNNIRMVIEECDAAFKNPISKRTNYAQLLEKIADSAYFFYIFDKKIMGYISFYANNFDAKIAYISLIAVRPEFQGQHIGSLLMKNCFEISKSKGMEKVQLEVKKNNTLAIRFYETNGFSYLYEKSNESFVYQKDLTL